MGVLTTHGMGDGYKVTSCDRCLGGTLGRRNHLVRDNEGDWLWVCHECYIELKR